MTYKRLLSHLSFLFLLHSNITEANYAVEDIESYVGS